MEERVQAYCKSGSHTHVKVVLPEDSGGEEDQADVFQVECEGKEQHPEEGETVDQQGGHPVTQQQRNLITKNILLQQHIIPT